MSEKELISKTPFPQTRHSLAENLGALGVQKGMVLLVHSSLRSLGWISGGSVAVVQALMDVVTEEGTIVVPTHSGDYSNPENWRNPPVPREWVQSIKETMPAFDPVYTPTRNMGKIVDCFRDFPGVIRSDHPLVSFAAWGKHKKRIVEHHQLDYSLGEHSPLGHIYALSGHVLLMGVSYAVNTSFHLAEYRTDIRKEVTQESPVRVNGKREWVIYKDIEYDESDFETIGAEFEKEGNVKRRIIGLAESRLFSQREAVDFAVKWFEKKKKNG